MMATALDQSTTSMVISTTLPTTTVLALLDLVQLHLD
jgi:hypothetical protein